MRTEFLKNDFEFKIFEAFVETNLQMSLGQEVATLRQMFLDRLPEYGRSIAVKSFWGHVLVRSLSEKEGKSLLKNLRAYPPLRDAFRDSILFPGDSRRAYKILDAAFGQTFDYYLRLQPGDREFLLKE